MPVNLTNEFPIYNILYIIMAKKHIDRMFANFKKRVINSLYGAAFSTVVSLIG